MDENEGKGWLNSEEEFRYPKLKAQVRALGTNGKQGKGKKEKKKKKGISLWEKAKAI